MAVVINGTTGVTTPTGTFATTIGVGGATPSASGAGITFPATQSASTNANTLDDYEEGTWTPVFDSDTPGTGRVTTVISATYTKVGRMVTVQFYANISTLGSGGGGAWVINGLPFAVSGGGAFSVSYASALLNAVYALGGEGNGTRIVMRYTNGITTAPIGNNANFATWVTGGTTLAGTMTYFV